MTFKVVCLVVALGAISYGFPYYGGSKGSYRNQGSGPQGGVVGPMVPGINGPGAPGAYGPGAPGGYGSSGPGGYGYGLPSGYGPSQGQGYGGPGPHSGAGEHGAHHGGYKEHGY